METVVSWMGPRIVVLVWLLLLAMLPIGNSDGGSVLQEPTPAAEVVNATASASDVVGRPGGAYNSIFATGEKEPWTERRLVFPSNLLLNETAAGRNNSNSSAHAVPLCNCWKVLQEGTELDECQCEGPLVARIPQMLSLKMHSLTITSAVVVKLRKMGLKKYKLLQDLTMSDLPEFAEIEAGAFANLTLLRTIYITQAPKLQTLPADVFLGVTKSLKSLRIINSGLIQVPDLRHLVDIGILNMVDLEGNRISTIESDSFNIKTGQLSLDNNDVTSIAEYAFRGSEIAKLSLKGNTNLVNIHSQAFAGIQSILELDLSSTSVTKIPHVGLQTLERLRIQHTHSLKTIPSLLNFRDLQEAHLTHSFHCCAFKYPARHDPAYYAERQRQKDLIQKQCSESTTKANPAVIESPQTPSNDGWGDPVENSWGEPVDSWGEAVDVKSRVRRHKSAKKRRAIEEDLHLKYSPKISIEEISSTSQEEEGIVPVTGTIDDVEEEGRADEEWANEQEVNYEDEAVEETNEDVFHDPSNDFKMDVICNAFTEDRKPIKCYPIPDDLNPCEDVMGSNWLRGSVWVVAFLAVFGNVLVLVVLLGSRSEMTVFKFLMCNLALADFCMGLYLLLLACIDLHSIGEYFNYAFDWQYGAGCKASGFLTNFASHLSVFTLTIITMERWFAITNALNLNKRLELPMAIKVMVGGWIYSIIMALLPLFGMSNYSSTSICLPMEARDWLDVTYLASLVLTNGLAFLVIVLCYGLIYYSLGKETRHKEMKIAKRMALLVFTNFVCWAPIAFFASTALAGYPLIDVAKSKILLVFFYPLNSCANPYLYAIMTAQYRRDAFQLLAQFGLCHERARKYKMSISTNIPLIERLSKAPNVSIGVGGMETGSAQTVRKISGECYL